MKRLIIDRQAVKSNLRMAIKRAGGAEIIADLGADAYGLGLLETAKLLRDEGVRNFAVFEPADASELRDAGFTEECIMMLRSTVDREELEQLIDLQVICTVGSSEAGVALNGTAEARGTIAEAQIEIDVGLGRYGFPPGELEKITSVYRYMNNLAVVGVFTAFSSGGRSKRLTQTQLAAFEDVVKKLRSQGFETGLIHAAGCSELFKFDFGRLDAVRVGPALTGRLPVKGKFGLQEVGCIEAGIDEVNWHGKGFVLGGRAVRKPVKLAALPVGSYHGFAMENRPEASGFGGAVENAFRELRRYFPGGRLFVTVGGGRARVMGGVGLLHTVVDITDLDCGVGDTAVMKAEPVNVRGIAREYR